jgi:hypothetical protein
MVCVQPASPSQATATLEINSLEGRLARIEKPGFQAVMRTYRDPLVAAQQS